MLEHKKSTKLTCLKKPSSSSPPSTFPFISTAFPSPVSEPEFISFCTTPRSTLLQLPHDTLKKIGLTADRLGMSNDQ